MAIRRPSLLSPFTYARRNFVTKGLLGGRRGWLVLGGLVWGVRGLRRFAGRSEEIAATETLRPGQSVTIVALPRQSRRRRRAAERDPG